MRHIKINLTLGLLVLWSGCNFFIYIKFFPGQVRDEYIGGSLLNEKVSPNAIAKNVIILIDVCFVILEELCLIAANGFGF